MGAIASQITSLTIAYSIVYSDADQRKHQSSAGISQGTGEFPAQRASYVENVSIWWRHHVNKLSIRGMRCSSVHWDVFSQYSSYQINRQYDVCDKLQNYINVLHCISAQAEGETDFTNLLCKYQRTDTGPCMHQ